MNIALFKNGTYQIFKDFKQITKYMQDIKYYLFDISTDLKGPVYTLVHKVNTEFINHTKLDVCLCIEYNNIDLPFSDLESFNYPYVVDSMNSAYGLYPLICQMSMFNFFQENQYESNEAMILIATITINDGNQKLEIDYMNEELSIIKNNFKSLGLLTHTDKVYHKNSVNDYLNTYSNLIITKSKWYFSDKVPNTFEYIGLYVISTESLYLLTYEEYHQLLKISYLNIQFFDVSSDGTDDYITDIAIESNDIEQILQFCLFVPQYVLLDQRLENRNIGKIRIYIELGKRKIDIVASFDEIDKFGLSLFNIINTIIPV